MNVGKRSGFDRLAPHYDRLARLVYGDEIRKAQTHFLSEIQAGSDVLILGGGTGWIISAILSVQSDCKICFIDSSPGMIELAKKRNPDQPNVNYILGTIANISERKFSVIILPFFVDLFPEHILRKTILSVKSASMDSSLWIVTDFADQGKWWQLLLLRGMYIFFRMLCSIESHTLPRWQEVMRELEFRKVESRSFYNGFIESCCYVNGMKMPLLK